MDMKRIGAACRTLRESLKLKQSDVGQMIGCSKENISAFENGRNNNATILAWYITHGLDIAQEAQNGEIQH